MMSTLYELTERQNNILALLDDETIEPEAIRAALDEIQGEVAEKCAGGIAIIRQLELTAEMYKAEADRLTERKRLMEKRVRDMKTYFQEQLDALGQTKVTTGRGVMSVQNNPAKLVIDDEQAIPAAYVTVVQTTKIDNAAIKKAFKDGEDVPGCHLETGRGLRIK